jgi:hypothetical protein
MLRAPATAVLAFVLTVVAGSPAAAQVSENGASATATADPNAPTVSEIEGDRAGFASQIVASWRERAEARGTGAGWDAELQRALASRTAEELFVASKARSWDELIGRAKNYRDASPHTIGGSLDDYVFYPITPCRIVDTRPAYGGSGAITAGTAKHFNTNGPAATIASQGGNPAGCPAIPSDPPAVVATVTAVTPAGNGNLVAYPYAASRPAASTVNYALPGTGLNLANTTVIPTCYFCGADFSVHANVNTVHVVVDVVGYFEKPICPSGTVGWNGHCYETTSRPGQTVFAAGAACASLGGRLATMSELRSLGHGQGCIGTNSSRPRAIAARPPMCPGSSRRVPPGYARSKIRHR